MFCYVCMFFFIFKMTLCVCVSDSFKEEMKRPNYDTLHSINSKMLYKLIRCVSNLSLIHAFHTHFLSIFHIKSIFLFIFFCFSIYLCDFLSCHSFPCITYDRIVSLRVLYNIIHLIFIV